MREEVFYTDIKNSRAQTNLAEKIKEALKEFEGRRIYVKIGVARKIRSLSENNYYWGVVIEYTRQGVEDLWGESVSKEQAHFILTSNCNFVEKISEATDEHIKVPKPTHNLTTIEFETYIERCRKFCGEMFGIEIPPPNSSMEMSFAD